MGYNSYFELTSEPPLDKLPELMLDEIADYDWRYYSPEDFTEDRIFFGFQKWYDYEIDLKEFSLSFPDILFILDRRGEDAGDLEKSYYKNGKSCSIYARIEFDEFNESMLTDNN